MKAIIINGNKAKVTEVPVPKLRPTYLLAKVEAIALNPTDWKHISGKRASEGCISGCDFAGTVVEVGSDVRSPPRPTGPTTASRKTAVSPNTPSPKRTSWSRSPTASPSKQRPPSPWACRPSVRVSSSKPSS
ncbi:hypothetical protein LTR48_000727 [Friedmanniomyces endolithicus]|uniref:Alcohol dehydrogenase-like N-terminal domain-containing protein n=1 Tax=Rachicladosporium monterosium TaxID=1507873 RepID=A0ABR0LFE3_9PEZI|nr:hypothetical protein LTR48_000727 [Friedmanniomyces endolithicus]KAK5147987.1 hypothetical protein LTR32_000624 [Rachicladosporium monterosium]